MILRHPVLVHIQDQSLWRSHYCYNQSELHRTYLRQQLGVKHDRKVGGIVEDIPESLVELQHGVDPTADVGRSSFGTDI